MIELLTRQQVLSLNPIFGSFILSVQDALYNPLKDYNLKVPSEMYFNDIEKVRFVSQEECDIMNDADNNEYLKRKDNFETISINKMYSGDAVYHFHETNIQKYLNVLSEGIENIAKKFDWKAMIFLLDFPTPWLHQKNNYKPVRKALNYFRTIGVDEIFTGGFKVKREGINEFITHLFWIIRCNASLPYCYFAGINSNTVLSICQYGNIHYSFYDIIEKGKLQEIAIEMGMTEVENEECYESFSESGAIEGRQIIV